MILEKNLEIKEDHQRDIDDQSKVTEVWGRFRDRHNETKTLERIDMGDHYVYIYTDRYTSYDRGQRKEFRSSSIATYPKFK